MVQKGTDIVQRFFIPGEIVSVPTKNWPAMKGSTEYKQLFYITIESLLLHENSRTEWRNKLDRFSPDHAFNGMRLYFFIQDHPEQLPRIIQLWENLSPLF
jgi:hypothetical protein